MSKLHRNAALSEAQRKLVKRLYEQGDSVSSLSRRFGVNRKTIDRWVKRTDVLDHPSGPKNPRRVVTEEYREAVIAHRAIYPDHGAVTITFHLKSRFSFANRGTVQQILTEQGLSKRVITQRRPPKNSM